MSRSSRLIAILTLFCVTPASYAQFIFSKCSYERSESAEEREFPDHFQLPARRERIPRQYQEIATWLFMQSYKIGDRTPEALAKRQRIRADMEMFWSVAFHERQAQCLSKNYAIGAAIVPVPRGTPHPQAPENKRVHFFVCHTYTDDVENGVQHVYSPLEPNSCKRIGDPRGYTLHEIQRRYTDLEETLKLAERTVNGSVMAASFAVPAVVMFLSRGLI